MDNKLGELLEHPVKLLIQNLHNSNIYSILVTIGNMQMCNNSISRDNQQPSYNLNGYKRFRD